MEMPLATAASAHLLRRRLVPAKPGGGGAPPLLAAQLGVSGAITAASRFSFCSLSSETDGAASPRSRCACSPGGKNDTRHLFDEFSVLSPDIPWEVEDVWRTFAAYFFILHIPLSFGGLSVVAKVLGRPLLDPLTTVAFTVVLQAAEFALALALLQHTAKPHHEVWAFFVGKLPLQNSWVKETVAGIGLLMALVSLTSIIADALIGHEDAYDPTLKEILSHSPTSTLVCFFLYCVIAPLSEETIYRGFLLTALSSSMKFCDAVIVSSLMFSVAHLSAENFLQLFAVGCILGSAYCRTGNLAASFTIHSCYNAVILLSTLMS